MAGPTDAAGTETVTATPGPGAAEAVDAAAAEPARRSINDVLWSWTAGAAARARRWPWWVSTAIIYFAARFVSFCIFEAVALHQGASPWGPAQPDYLHFIGIWDSRWYQQIFAGGYPDVIPRSASGAARQNAWAFYPLYPFLVRGISTVTGLDWPVLAPAVSLLAGLGAALVIYRLFRLFADRSSSLWGVTFFAVFPVSAVLQVPYAESLSTLLIAGALFLLVRRRYLWAVPVVILMCLARPAAVPFAAVVAVHLALRLYRRRHGRPERREPFSGVQLLAGAALLLVSAVSAFAWPAIAWALTGEMTAYTDTEAAWRGGGLTLFQPWFSSGRQLFGPFWGPLAPVLLVVLFALYMNTKAVRAIGSDLRVWCVVYFCYLLAVLQPQTSTFRMLLPMFPLALSTALVSRSRAYRGAVVVLFVLLQIVWVTWLWAWAKLPGGGDYPP